MCTPSNLIRTRCSLAAVVFWLLLSGVASRAAEQPVELVLWNLTQRPASSPGGTAVLDVFDQFLQAHPRIRIIQGGGPQLQRFGRGTREFLMAQAGGIAPDAVAMIDVDLQDFMARNFLLPLNDYLKDAGMLDDILAHPLAHDFTRDGLVYALPVAPLRFRPTSYVLI